MKSTLPIFLNVLKVEVKSLSRARLFATPWIVCTKLLRPWDFQGKSTRVGCHFLLQGIFPTQGLNPGLSHCRQTLYHLSHQGSPKMSCCCQDASVVSTLCDPMDCSLPGFSICGILQARTLEWVSISFSNAWKWKVKVKSFSLSDSQWPHGLQPTRLLHPWDIPGKSTGVGCHCLLPHTTNVSLKYNYI